MTRILLTATVGLALAILSGCCYTPGRVSRLCTFHAPAFVFVE
jgi:hypothetical protein